jgi:hypothetical protein
MFTSSKELQMNYAEEELNNLVPPKINNQLLFLRKISYDLNTNDYSELNEDLYLSINALRALRKYNIKFFNFLFDNLYHHFPKFLSCQNVKISRISFKLICETFSELHSNNFTENWIRLLLPKFFKQITLKSLRGKLYLYEDSLKAIYSISNSFYSQQILEVLFSEVSNQNFSISSMALQILIKVINNQDPGHLYYFGDWNCYFAEIIMLAKSIKGIYRKNAEKLIFVLWEFLGAGYFVEVINKLDIEYVEKQRIFYILSMHKSKNKRALKLKK